MAQDPHFTALLSGRDNSAHPLLIPLPRAFLRAPRGCRGNSKLHANPCCSLEKGWQGARLEAGEGKVLMSHQRLHSGSIRERVASELLRILQPTMATSITPTPLPASPSSWMAHVPHAFLERYFWLLPSLPLGMSSDPSPAVGGEPFPQGPTHVIQGGPHTDAWSLPSLPVSRSSSCLQMRKLNTAAGPGLWGEWTRTSVGATLLRTVVHTLPSARRGSHSHLLSTSHLSCGSYHPPPPTSVVWASVSSRPPTPSTTVLKSIVCMAIQVAVLKGRTW